MLGRSSIDGSFEAHGFGLPMRRGAVGRKDGFASDRIA
jgi:hypothetical protein